MSRARVFYSRDVVFNELSTEVQKEMPKQEERKFVEVECEDWEEAERSEESNSSESESEFNMESIPEPTVPRRSERER